MYIADIVLQKYLAAVTSQPRLSRAQRKAVLKSADVRQTNINIEVIPGIALAPRAVGDTGHYETLGGKPILYPSAYRAKGWNTMRYVGSSRRIEVGSMWIDSVVE